MNKIKSIALRHHVHQALEDYFSQLEGHKPANLYEMVIKEIEMPLIQSILKYTNNNQSLAAEILGISRGTLRKKLRTFNLS